MSGRQELCPPGRLEEPGQCIQEPFSRRHAHVEHWMSGGPQRTVGCAARGQVGCCAGDALAVGACGCPSERCRAREVAALPHAYLEVSLIHILPLGLEVERRATSERLDQRALTPGVEVHPKDPIGELDGHWNRWPRLPKLK